MSPVGETAASVPVCGHTYTHTHSHFLCKVREDGRKKVKEIERHLEEVDREGERCEEKEAILVSAVPHDCCLSLGFSTQTHF